MLHTQLLHCHAPHLLRLQRLPRLNDEIFKLSRLEERRGLISRNVQELHTLLLFHTYYPRCWKKDKKEHFPPPKKKPVLLYTERKKYLNQVSALRKTYRIVF